MAAPRRVKFNEPRLLGDQSTSLLVDYQLTEVGGVKVDWAGLNNLECCGLVDADEYGDQFKGHNYFLLWESTYRSQIKLSTPKLVKVNR